MLSAPDLPPLTDPSFAHAFPLGLKSATALRVTSAAAFHALTAKCGLLSSPFLSSALIASYGTFRGPCSPAACSTNCPLATPSSGAQ
jgi:hypothetical protein